MSQIFDACFPQCMDAAVGGDVLTAAHELDAAVLRLRQLADRVEDQELREQLLAELDRL